MALLSGTDYKNYAELVMGKVVDRTTALESIAQDQLSSFGDWYSQMNALQALTVPFSTVTPNSVAGIGDGLPKPSAESGYSLPTAPALDDPGDINLGDEPAGITTDLAELGEVGEPSLNAVTTPDELELEDPDTATPGLVDIGGIRDIEAESPEYQGIREVTGADFPDIDWSRVVVDEPALAAFESKGDYASELLEKLKTELRGILDRGGVGLGETVQQYMFDLFLDQQNWNGSREEEKILRDEASTGFRQPQGSRNAMLLAMAIDKRRARDAAAKEIMVKEADLAWQQYQAALGEVRQLETVLMAHWNDSERVRLEVWKTAADFTLEIFKARIEDINLYLRAMELQTTLIAREQEIQIAGLQADIAQNQFILQRYKTEVEVQEALQRGDISKVDATLRTNELRLNQKRLDYDGHRLKLDSRVANSQVQATVSANQIEQNRQLLELHRTNLETKVKKLEADIAHQTAQIQAAQLDLGVYEAKLKKEGEITSRIASLNQNRTQLFSSETQLFSAEADRVYKEASLVVANNQLDLQRYQIGADLTLNRDKMNMDYAIRAHELWQQQVLAMGNVLSQQLASLYTAVNASLGMSYSNQFGASVSQAENYYESHDYDEKCCS